MKGLYSLNPLTTFLYLKSAALHQIKPKNKNNLMSSDNWSFPKCGAETRADKGMVAV